MFLHIPLNTAIIQVLGCTGGARSLTERFYPRPLTFNRFVDDMRLPASLLSFAAYFRSEWKGFITMKSSLSGSLVLRGFKPCPPALPDTFDF